MRQLQEKEDKRLEREHELKLLERKSRAAQDIVAHHEGMVQKRILVAFREKADRELESRDDEILKLKQKIQKNKEKILNMSRQIQQEVENNSQLEDINADQKSAISKNLDEIGKLKQSVTDKEMDVQMVIQNIQRKSDKITEIKDIIAKYKMKINTLRDNE